jgi:hypothetical protein
VQGLLFEAKTPHADDKEEEREACQDAYLRDYLGQAVPSDDEVLEGVEGPGVGRDQAYDLGRMRHDEARHKTAPRELKVSSRSTVRLVAWASCGQRPI